MNIRTIYYSSYFEKGIKRRVVLKGGFAPVMYSHDSTGALKAIISPYIFYKKDERGNRVTRWHLKEECGYIVSSGLLMLTV